MKVRRPRKHYLEGGLLAAVSLVILTGVPFSALATSPEASPRYNWQAELPALSLPPTARPQSADISTGEPESIQEPSPSQLQASISGLSPWEKNFNYGQRAFKNHQYDIAQARLLAASKETQRFHDNDLRSLKTRIALADVYCMVEKFAQAKRLYDETLSAAQKQFGQNSPEVAQIYYGLAFVDLAQGRVREAELLARQSVSVADKTEGARGHFSGMAINLLAETLSRQGWFDEAEPVFRKSLAILETTSPPNDLDLANGLHAAALFYRARGKRSEAANLFQRSYQAKEKNVKFDQPFSGHGEVTFDWDDDCPQVTRILEGSHPVKSLTVAGARFFTTVVDLGDHRVGVLISIRNETREPMDMELGPVAIEVVSPKHLVLPPLNLDSSLNFSEERAFGWLTEHQPFLANVLITRKNPPLLQGEMPDLSRNLGGNVFGLYGQWGVAAGGVLDMSMKAHSRQVVELLTRPEAELDSRPTGLMSISLEPGESRSGLLFFVDPRFEHAILELSAGNATLRIPFKQNGAS